jgi:Predicted Zn-dependent protease (DUF2268)
MAAEARRLRPFGLMRGPGLICSIALWVIALAAPAGAATRASHPGGAAGPAIHTEDVTRFYELYDSTAGRPSVEQLQHYLDTGSDGLQQFARIRRTTGARIAENMLRQPEVYSGAKRCMAVLPKVRERLDAALRRLVELYPEAHLPPITIAVGRGKPVAVGSPVTGIQIGLEALCATDWMGADVEDRFVYVIAHEYAHVQQAVELVDNERPTVLEGSLIEGVAELVGELMVGDVAYAQLRTVTRGREREIETAFLSDLEKTDLSNWLNNSTVEKPGDLGYWVGHRIARSYYQRAADKRQALRELLQATDARAVLAKSGWYPGMELE